MKEGDVIADRYRLVRVIGSGGMGAVWLAEHTSLKTTIAIKLVHSNLSDHPDVRSRFSREAQIAARLKSAHVVQVFDHGITEDGQPFIAMEWLEGVSVRERLDARRRMTVDETATLVKHVCRALTRAHEAGLVHRDLKPENLFIVKEGDEEIVKVLDFGVAKSTDALSYDGVDPTRTGALMGTPFYMSPEQAIGLKSIDATTDLWALGAVVFECLTGVRAFTAPALGPLIVKIVNGPTPVPSQVAPDAGLTADIDAWVARALARDKADRFATAKELSEAFMVASGSVDSLMRSGGHPVISPAHAREATTATLIADPAIGLADTVATTPVSSPRPAPAVVTVAHDLPTTLSSPPPAPVVPASTGSRTLLLAVIGVLVLVVIALAAALLMRR
jgi:serine/threonine protein kinase